MEKFLDECKSTIHEVQELLVTNREHWVRRFSNYANDIHRNEKEIRNKKKKTFNDRTYANPIETDGLRCSCRK